MYETEEDQIDYSKLKYVLYARKSTVDETRQVRSIPDQIAECLGLAKRLGLNVAVDYLQETQSAKKPHQRPIFRKMIRDIKLGVYDGILAWNPDRLARNMLEGGEIIDLIDQNVIKDLRFVTHTFTNNANGKMLLGMAFVLSKQYSDDLSQKVTRGVRRRAAEGKTPVPKHGYINEEGIYRPDGKNHELICIAWQMRKEGTSIDVINDFLVKNGYSKTIKRTGAKIGMTIQKLSRIFHDPFYYGILVQISQSVDLRAIYDFVPAVSEEDYFVVQSLQYKKMKPTKPHSLAFYPFRQMVQCAYCSKFMLVAPSSGKTKKYLYFRCDTKYCERSKKSIRAKIVVNFIYDLIRDGLNFTEKEYQTYLTSVTVISDQKRENIRKELHNCQGVLKHIKSEIKERSLKIVDYEEKGRVWKENSDKIIELEQREEKLERDIISLKNKLASHESDKLSIDQFLNLSKNAITIVQSADKRRKDIICRLIFLNFTVDEEKVLSYQLKEPFATLMKQRHLSSSRGAGN